MFNYTGRKGLAPLVLITGGGSDYFVKLVDPASGRDLFGLYVRGGQRIEVPVPLGSYEMRYASGDVWYGRGDLFGPDTVTARATTLFHFQDQGMQYMGYTVELIRQTGGNLPTRSIPTSEF